MRDGKTSRITEKQKKKLAQIMAGVILANQ